MKKFRVIAVFLQNDSAPEPTHAIIDALWSKGITVQNIRVDEALPVDTLEEPIQPPLECVPIQGMSKFEIGYTYKDKP